VIPTLPLRARNRLAHLILTALGDERARAELAALARGDGPHEAFGDATGDRLSARLIGRARAASTALADLPTLDPERRLDDALLAAAALFDAGVLFEVHEVLEPHWRDAGGPRRELLQGLIQIAVGYQHLANANVDGARALLHEGVERLRSHPVDAEFPGLDLRAFADAVARSTARLTDLDAGSIPRFPRLERSTIRSEIPTRRTT